MDFEIKNKELLERQIAEEFVVVEQIDDFIKDEDDLPEVEEDLFKIYLLPYILGLTIKSKENDDAFFANYYALVGDLKLPFYVVNRAGERLFKVPALLADYDSKYPVDKVAYYKIINDYRETAENNPLLAEKQVATIMAELANIFKISENSVKEFIEFYNTVRERYKDLIESYGKEEKQVEQVPEEDEDDGYLDLDYED